MALGGRLRRGGASGLRLLLAPCALREIDRLAAAALRDAARRKKKLRVSEALARFDCPPTRNFAHHPEMAVYPVYPE
jgi:hypothetical protein